MPVERRTFTREQLYDLVWTKPVEDVARELGLSGRGLGKLCSRMVVPVPYRGYWARKAAGQRVTKTHLPKARAEYPAEHTFIISTETHLEQDAGAEEPAIVVPATLTDPHPLIVTTERALRGLIPSPKILLLCTDQPILDVTVSEPQLDCALRVIDTILKTAIARGDTIEICDAVGAQGHMGWVHAYAQEKTFSTWICRDGDAIRLHLEQEQHQVRLPDPLPPPEPPQPKRRRHYEARWCPPPSPRYEWRAVGGLRLRIEFRYVGQSFQQNWNSSEHRPLERQLNRFFRELDKIFACLRPLRLAREEERHAEAEAERLAEEERQRVIAERRRVHDLRSRLRDWTTSIGLDEFIGAAEKDAVTRLGPIAPDSDLAEWLTWAKSYAVALRDDAICTVPLLRELPDDPPHQPEQVPANIARTKSYWETRHLWHRR
jgi:hypothetical protein